MGVQCFLFYQQEKADGNEDQEEGSEEETREEGRQEEVVQRRFARNAAGRQSLKRIPHNEQPRAASNRGLAVFPFAVNCPRDFRGRGSGGD